MIPAVRNGGPKRVLESADLVAMGRSGTAGMTAQLGRDA
jgi:negative regulator of sigma E activity